MRNICGRKQIMPQPNLCYRKGGKSIVVDEAEARTFPMDDVPTPNYDEYFERLRRSSLHRIIR